MTVRENNQHTVTSRRLQDAPLTFQCVPDKMTHPVEAVECERRSENSLPCELHSFRKARNELDDVCTIESSGNEEVGKGIAVKHYPRQGGREKKLSASVLG